MDSQKEYTKALKNFYYAQAAANEAKKIARQAFQRMKKEEKGFGQGDVIEYDGKQGVFAGWEYPYELRENGEILQSNSFYPYRKDGSLSTRKRYIFHIEDVKVIERT